MSEPRIYTEEEIRDAINSKTPLEALEMLTNLFQRMTLALEGINEALQQGPAVVFEPETQDGDDTFSPCRPPQA